MNDDKSPRYYLIAAILWSALALAALVILLCSTLSLFGKLCGLVLTAMCMAGPWMRYFKKK